MIRIAIYYILFLTLLLSVLTIVGCATTPNLTATLGVKAESSLILIKHPISGFGSGTYVRLPNSQHGIVTAAHVAALCSTPCIILRHRFNPLGNFSREKARVSKLGRDLAFYPIELEGIPAQDIEFGYTPKVGERFLFVGNPYGFLSIPSEAKAIMFPNLNRGKAHEPRGAIITQGAGQDSGSSGSGVYSQSGKVIAVLSRKHNLLSGITVSETFLQDDAIWYLEE